MVLIYRSKIQQSMQLWWGNDPQKEEGRYSQLLDIMIMLQRLRKGKMVRPAGIEPAICTFEACEGRNLTRCSESGFLLYFTFS
jgi:hypothetical protein